MKRLVLCWLLGALLIAQAGCGRLRLAMVPENHWKPVAEDVLEAPPKSLPVTAFPAPRKVSDPLTYFNHVQGLTEFEQNKEFKVVKQRFEKYAGEEDRWRLILLSLLPGQPFSNHEYAQELLNGRKRSGNSAGDPRSGLAKLLGLLLADQKALGGQLADEKKRAETLNRQLEELKEIETILGEREKSRPAGAGQ